MVKDLSEAQWPEITKDALENPMFAMIQGKKFVPEPEWVEGPPPYGDGCLYGIRLQNGSFFVDSMCGYGDKEHNNGEEYVQFRDRGLIVPIKHITHHHIVHQPSKPPNVKRLKVVDCLNVHDDEGKFGIAIQRSDGSVVVVQDEQRNRQTVIGYYGSIDEIAPFWRLD